MTSERKKLDRQLDRIASDFEDAWNKDKWPEFEKFLAKIDAGHRSELLRVLLEVDLELREDNGLSVDPSNYESLGENYVAMVNQLRAEASLHDFDLHTISLDKTPQETDQSSSRQIGPYKLLQQIGEGGMGTVWMAEQREPIQRRVAVKVIKAGMDSKHVIARFEAERQALAMMDHQNIARVLDAGMTEDGRPYFAMELVKGIPLTTYCDDNQLTPKQRLELFVAVCNAIQHAHQKGIIHRDLKPTNVLVALYDGKPIPKVIDFGLAKALQHQAQLTDKTMFTEFGQVVGTVQYMSPEQAEMNALDVDTRTDIYSLGVMLYELLTGSTPLEQETLKQQAILEVLQLIREKDPPRPSNRLSSSGDAITGISAQRKISPARLQQILRGELDWIAMKALEKDRTRRYETAAEFADDVQRYLADETVKARPPSAAYRFGKFVRKNRSLVITTFSIFFLLIAGITGTILGLIDANHAREESAESERIAIEEKKEADEQRNIATQALAISNTQAYSLGLRLAHVEWNWGDRFKANQILASTDFDSKGPEYDYLKYSIQSQFKDFGEEGVNCFDVFSDGGMIATAMSGGKVLIREIDTEEIIRETTLTEDCTTLHFSSDGKKVHCFVPALQSIIEIDVTNGLTRSVLSNLGIINYIQFAPGPNLVFFAEETQHEVAIIKGFDLNTGQKIYESEKRTSFRAFSISEDGETLALAKQKGIDLISVSDGLIFKSFDYSCDYLKLIKCEAGQQYRQAYANNTDEGKDLLDPLYLFAKVNVDSEDTDIKFAPGISKSEWLKRSGRLIARDLVVLHVKTGKTSQTFGETRRFAVSPNGQRLVVLGDTGYQRWARNDWKADTGEFKEPEKPFDWKRIGDAIATPETDASQIEFFGHDLSFVTLSSRKYDRRVRRWENANIDLKQLLKNRAVELVSPTGDQVVTSKEYIAKNGYKGRGAYAWDTRTGKDTHQYSHDFNCIAYSPNGALVATGGSDYRIIIWNATNGEKILEFKNKDDPDDPAKAFQSDQMRSQYGGWNTNEIIFTENSNYLVTRQGGSKVRVWNMNQVGPPIEIENISEIQSLRGNRIIAQSVTGRYAQRKGQLVVIDVAENKTLFEINHDPKGIHALSTDRTSLAIASPKQKVQIYDLQNGSKLGEFDEPSKMIRSMSFSPDCQLIACAVVDRENLIKLVDWKNGSTVKSIPAQVSRIEFSLDGSRIIGFGQDSIGIWDIATRVELIRLFKRNERIRYSDQVFLDLLSFRFFQGDATKNSHD